jgi:hypothetical protein
MKYVADREYADPAKAARKLLEIANTVEAIQDGRIHIERINGPFLFKEGGTPPNTRLARHCARLAVETRVRHLCEV